MLNQTRDYLCYRGLIYIYILLYLTVQFITTISIFTDGGYAAK